MNDSGAAGGQPVAGWYDDPGGSAQLRYWDGSAWTEHTTTIDRPSVPQQPQWGDPGQWTGQPGSGGAPPPYGTYTPTSGPLAPSGMRRVEALFADIGRIVKRGWWPITAVSLIIWAVWTALVVVVIGVLIDIPRLFDAIDFLVQTSEDTSNRTLSPQTQQEIEQNFLDALRVDSPVVWIVLGLLLFLLTMFASCAQVAGVNRVAMDTASGSQASLAAAFQSARVGGLRILGYGLLLSAGVLAVLAVLVGVIVLIGSVVAPLAVVLAMAPTVALMVGGVWIFTRLLPFTAQAVVSGGALMWSWRATEGKFWAVLGRWLLWSIVAYLAVQVISAVLFFPVSIVLGAASSTQDAAAIGWVFLLVSAVAVPISLVLNSASLLGVVPIWRDLTEQPEYRSIDEHGQPVAVA